MGDRLHRRACLVDALGPADEVEDVLGSPGPCGAFAGGASGHGCDFMHVHQRESILGLTNIYLLPRLAPCVTPGVCSAPPKTSSTPPRSPKCRRGGANSCVAPSSPPRAWAPAPPSPPRRGDPRPPNLPRPAARFASPVGPGAHGF